MYIYYITCKEGSGKLDKAICIKTRDSLGKLPCKLWSVVEIQDDYLSFYGLKVRGTEELMYYDKKAFRRCRGVNSSDYDKVNDLLQLIKKSLSNESFSLIDQANLVIHVASKINSYLRR